MTTPTPTPTQVAAAAEVVVAHQLGSVRLIETRLGVDWGTAACLMSYLEDAGIVGPHKPWSSRDVLFKGDEVDKAKARLAEAAHYDALIPLGGDE